MVYFITVIQSFYYLMPLHLKGKKSLNYVRSNESMNSFPMLAFGKVGKIRI